MLSTTVELIILVEEGKRLMETGSPLLQADSLPSEPPGKPWGKKNSLFQRKLISESEWKNKHIEKREDENQ